MKAWVRSSLILFVWIGGTLAQQPAAPPAQPASPAQPAPAPQAPAATPAQAAPQQPAPAAPQPAPATTTPATPPVVYGGLSLNNASLTEVIDLLARQLKINYILDPRVKGGVILNTYGETKDIDTRSLLETILRINGYGMVKQGDLYRIVPLPEISHLPLPPENKTDANSIPDDDQTMLNLVFLKYVTADELMKVLQPFVGENASIYTYGPANLLLILDSRRNMRRLMDLIAMFDSDQLANERVRVFDVKNGRPTDLAKELDTIVKSIALSDKSAPIRFLPVDRINIIIAVAPNPGAFKEVETWLAKLDTPVKITAGAVNNYVYRVRFGDAQSIGCSIQALYGQLTASYGPAGYGGGYGAGSIAQCMGQSGMGVGGVAGMPGSAGAPGVYPGQLYQQSAYGGAGAYGAGMNGQGYPGGAYGSPYGYPAGAAAPAAASPFSQAAPAAGGAAATQAPATTGGSDLTGNYLGIVPGAGPGSPRLRVVANPYNNTLLIQATPQEYAGILQLLKDLDVPPRQVLVEAKIYSIDVTYAISSGISAQLQTLAGTTARSLLGGLTAAGTVQLTGAMLVGKSRELLANVQVAETEMKAKVLSTPAVIATDSIPASINVGSTVPTLSGSTASGITGAVTNSISNANTGTGLNIVARVTPSGIVTMMINQSVSDPEPTTTSAIASPSFATQSINTQVTVQDGDTIAVGGMIAENTTVSTAGIPVLDRIPYLGVLFGQKSYTKERSELIIFLTPHVIYDNNQLLDASDELRNGIKLLRKDVKE